MVSRHSFAYEDDEDKLIKDRATVTRQLMILESKMQDPVWGCLNFFSAHSIANHLILLVSL